MLTCGTDGGKEFGAVLLCIVDVCWEDDSKYYVIQFSSCYVLSLLVRNMPLCVADTELPKGEILGTFSTFHTICNVGTTKEQNLDNGNCC